MNKTHEDIFNELLNHAKAQMGQTGRKSDSTEWHFYRAQFEVLTELKERCAEMDRVHAEEHYEKRMGA